MNRALKFLSAALGFAVGFTSLWLALPTGEVGADAAVPSVSPTRAASESLVELEPADRPDAAADGPAVVGESGPRIEPPPAPEAAAAERDPVPDPVPDPTGTVVWGLVSLPDGSPAAEAHVGAPDRDGHRVGTQADSQGRYALGPLAPGAWTVSAGAMDHESDSAELVLEEADGPRRQDFVLVPQQRIHVFLLTAAGEPTLAQVAQRGRRQALPVATREHPGPTFEGVAGSLNNTFGIGSFWQAGWRTPSIGPGHVGTVTIEGREGGWMSYVIDHQVVASEPFDPETERITFVLEPEDFDAQLGRVRGRLIDPATGEGVAADVAVSAEGFAMGPMTTVEDDGTFDLVDVPPGMRYLIVQAPERAYLARPIVVEVGQVLDLGDVELPIAVSISGTVRNSEGSPMAARIECGRIDGVDGRVVWPPNRAYASDAGGQFQIDGLVPGRYLVRSPGLNVLGPRYSDDSVVARPVLVDATAAAVEGVELTLEGSTAVVLVTEVESEPWPRVDVLDPGGLEVIVRTLGRWGAEVPIRLAPGDYTLVVSVEGELLEERPLTVGAEPLRVDL